MPVILSSSGLLLLYGSLILRRGCWIVYERIAKAAAGGTHLQSQVRPVGRRHFGTRLQRGKSSAASLFLRAHLWQRPQPSAPMRIYAGIRSPYAQFYDSVRRLYSCPANTMACFMRATLDIISSSGKNARTACICSSSPSATTTSTLSPRMRCA